MFQLNKFSDTFLKEYQEKIWLEFEKKLNASSIKDKILDVLNETEIKELFILSPEQLKKKHDDIMPSLGSWDTLEDYNAFFILIKKRNKTEKEENLVLKYKLELEIIENLFAYKEMISSKKPFSYWLADHFKCNTCTYCNRNYTFTISKDKTTGRQNNDTRITRPQFDHWFSKSQHPILALSIYNLIPSCSICNSGIKGAKEFNLVDHVHPFIPHKETFKFSYTFNSANQPTVKIKIDAKNKKLTNTIGLMKLNELYQAHDDFELKDLYDLSKKYSKNYTKSLFSESFKGLNLDDNEIYRLIFGVDTEDHQKRLMSKYKHDIIEELRKIM